MSKLLEADRKAKRLLWAKLTLALGFAALVPGVGFPFAAAGLGIGVFASILTVRKPTRYGGKGLLSAGLILTVLGLVLFLFEAHAFLTWKIRQAEAGRTTISEYRMGTITYALERFRQATGRYPKASSVRQLDQVLVPRFAPSLPSLDGWGRPFAFSSNGLTYTLSCQPPSRNGIQLPALVDSALYPLPPPRDTASSGRPLQK